MIICPDSEFVDETYTQKSAELLPLHLDSCNENCCDQKSWKEIQNSSLQNNNERNTASSEESQRLIPPLQAWKIQAGDSYHTSCCEHRASAEDRQALRTRADYHKLNQGAIPTAAADPVVDSINTWANQPVPWPDFQLPIWEKSVNVHVCLPIPTSRENRKLLAFSWQAAGYFHFAVLVLCQLWCCTITQSAGTLSSHCPTGQDGTIPIGSVSRK